MPFVTAMNAACAFLLVCLIHINALKTNTKIIVLYAERTCFPPANLHRICHVDTPFMLTVLENSLDLITGVPYARKQLFLRNPWQLHGKPGLEILQNIPCQLIYSVWLILCATIVKQRAIEEIGTFWEYSVLIVIHSTRSSNKL